MELQIPTSFQTPFIGGLEEVKPGISKARLGIYYLGKNRNRGYITKEFSELLDKDIAYQPVVGIYSKEKADFLGHSEDKGEANIYGLIPANPNLGWNERVDKDGVKRTYRTVDVYLYTGRLEVAKTIVGLPQSMELNPKTLKGDWTLIDGEPYFVYKEGNYIGFSVLGKNVEPCFEGSCFYSENKEKFFEMLEKFSYFMQNGGNNMENSVKTPENQAIENSVNEQCAEPETEPKVEPTQENEQVAEPETEPETKPDTESEAESEAESEQESEAPESYALTGEELIAYHSIIENFESLQNVVVKFSDMTTQIENLNGKIVEFENTNNTLKSEAEQAKVAFEDLTSKYEAAKAIITDMETKKKKALCEKYSKVVPADAMEVLQAKMDDYSVEEFEKELTYAGRDSLFNPSNSAPTSYDYNHNEDSHLKKLLEEAKKQRM